MNYIMIAVTKVIIHIVSLCLCYIHFQRYLQIDLLTDEEDFLKDVEESFESYLKENDLHDESADESMHGF